MRPNTNSVTIESIFAQNLKSLIGHQHTITSLSRDLGLHRNQLQRFVDGVSFPKPSDLTKMCNFFNVDARILTHPLRDLCGLQSAPMPPYLAAVLDPAPAEILPDGFYEEWRELHTCNMQYSCHILFVKTVRGVRQTKVNVRRSIIGANQEIAEFGAVATFQGAAYRQAGGLCMIDRPDQNTSITFTALRSGCYGNNELYAGHKKSVRGALGEPLPMKSAVAMRYLVGGYAEAMRIRRKPRFRTTYETPELIRALIADQQANAEFA